MNANSNSNNKMNADDLAIKLNSFLDELDNTNKQQTNTYKMNKRYINQIIISKEGFDEYLASKITNKMKARMDKYMEGNEEEPIYGYTFRLENPTDRQWEYSICFLLDCDGGYMPIFNTGVNTSSYFALWSCGIYADENDDDENDMMTMEEICDMVMKDCRNGFVKVCEEIEKKPIKLNAPENKIEEVKIEKIIETEIEDKQKDIDTEMNANNTKSSISTETPLFMREGGEAEIDRRRKELATYLKLLNANPEQMIRNHTFVCLNPSTLDPKMVGEEQANEIKRWFGTEQTKRELKQWLGCGTHKVDGKSWSCGFLGSRWADKKINGRMVRFAFYADKDEKPDHLKHLSYSIMLDASN